jgi:hypothetical protein
MSHLLNVHVLLTSKALISDTYLICDNQPPCAQSTSNRQTQTRTSVTSSLRVRVRVRVYTLNRIRVHFTRSRSLHIAHRTPGHLRNLLYYGRSYQYHPNTVSSLTGPHGGARCAPNSRRVGRESRETIIGRGSDEQEVCVRGGVGIRTDFRALQADMCVRCDLASSEIRGSSIRTRTRTPGQAILCALGWRHVAPRKSHIALCPPGSSLSQQQRPSR